jgi:hypothetical protein
MAIKTVLTGLFLIFFSSALLVDCVHKKNTSEESGNTEELHESLIMMNTLTSAEEEAGWQLLFDGRSLEGWRGFRQEGPPEGWMVEEGQLVALGKGSDLTGDIITEGVYADFELVLEWKISNGGNSGIFFRIVEDDYPTVYATGPEYQLIDDLGYPAKLEDWHSCGANYGMHAPDQPPIKPAGDWNASRLVVDSTRVTHYLNGKKIVEYELWGEDWMQKVREGKWAEYPGYGMARSGHIGLQDHGDKIWFRNIKIRNL